MLVRDWARDGLLLIGDAAHTMSPAGAIGVNVALSTAAVAAQVIFPHLGHGAIADRRWPRCSGSARGTCARSTASSAASRAVLAPGGGTRHALAAGR